MLLDMAYDYSSIATSFGMRFAVKVHPPEYLPNVKALNAIQFSIVEALHPTTALYSLEKTSQNKRRQLQNSKRIDSVSI